MLFRVYLNKSCGDRSPFIQNYIVNLPRLNPTRPIPSNHPSRSSNYTSTKHIYLQKSGSILPLPDFIKGYRAV